MAVKFQTRNKNLVSRIKKGFDDGGCYVLCYNGGYSRGSHSDYTELVFDAVFVINDVTIYMPVLGQIDWKMGVCEKDGVVYFGLDLNTGIHLVHGSERLYNGEFQDNFCRQVVTSPPYGQSDANYGVGQQLYIEVLSHGHSDVGSRERVRPWMLDDAPSYMQYYERFDQILRRATVKGTLKSGNFPKCDRNILPYLVYNIDDDLVTYCQDGARSSKGKRHEVTFGEFIKDIGYYTDRAMELTKIRYFTEWTVTGPGIKNISARQV